MIDEKVSLVDVLNVIELFNSKKWLTKSGYKEALKNFVEMLVNFTEPQKKLIFELSNRYLWISFSEYYELLIKTLDLVEDEKLKPCKRIVLFPIVKIKDVGKVKSSNALLYSFKATNFGNERYKNINFKIIENYKNFEKEKFGINDLVFLVDDYVGSGDTLTETINEISKNSTLKNDIINVITLVTQKEILSELEKRNISYYSTNIINKGISDNYTSSNLEEKIKIMEEIETYIPNVGDYSFGYNKSEALVTMHRTPNNTFPIFWRSHKVGGKVFRPPFER